MKSNSHEPHRHDRPKRPRDVQRAHHYRASRELHSAVQLRLAYAYDVRACYRRSRYAEPAHDHICAVVERPERFGARLTTAHSSQRRRRECSRSGGPYCHCGNSFGTGWEPGERQRDHRWHGARHFHWAYDHRSSWRLHPAVRVGRSDTSHIGDHHACGGSSGPNYHRSPTPVERPERAGFHGRPASASARRRFQPFSRGECDSGAWDWGRQRNAQRPSGPEHRCGRSRHVRRTFHFRTDRQLHTGVCGRGG